MRISDNIIGKTAGFMFARSLSKGAALAFCAAIASYVIAPVSYGQTARLELVSNEPQCDPARGTCEDYDAIIFVHGIYGDQKTFRNTATAFDWPQQFPHFIRGRPIVVYRLSYYTALLSWAHAKNPSFEQVSNDVFVALKPLRQKQFRSINFIAHSLGGNVVSTYIHLVKTALGDPQRSQHGFVITLATPVLGAQIADVGNAMTTLLGIDDQLLRSLKQGNLYLEMLNDFRVAELTREERYTCRPVHLHAAFEKKYLGPLLVVSKDSAALAISNLASSPVVGFERDHLGIAKPTGVEDDVYKWVDRRVSDEFMQLATWQEAHRDAPKDRQLCEKVSFVPE